MDAIPREAAPDSTLALARDPYGFIADRCRRHGSDAFEARIMLQRTICLTGHDAAALFYDPERFMRAGAAPGRLEKALFGRGGVQGLDGEAHRNRKRMLMSLMTPERLGALGEIAEECWRRYARQWQTRDSVVLYDQVQRLLCEAVCRWAGVPLADPEVESRSAELTALFEQAGAVGPKYWWGRLARRRAERWAGDVIAGVRAGRLHPPEHSAAHVIAGHRDPDGALLRPPVAAVELLNVLRPAVAVAVFVTFAAVALHQYPAARRGLQADAHGYLDLFVQEVRRFYPFFPAVAARVRRDFEWRGYRFPARRRVLLDLYGTNHDGRVWENPDAFLPERFMRWDEGPYNFIPQGGGDHYLGHRCAGEWGTLELMRVAVRFLSEELAFRVPEQDLSIDRSRLPALPRSRVVLETIRMLR